MTSARPARRPRLILLGSILLGLFVLLLVWVGLLALQAHRIAAAAHALENQVTVARQDLHNQGSAQNTTTRISQDLVVLQQRAGQFGDRTHGIIWASGRYLPGLSGSVQETDAVADTARNLSTQVLPAFIRLAQAAPELRDAKGDIDVALLARQLSPVTAATNRLDQLTATLAAVPRGGIRPLDDGRTRLLSAMTELQDYGRSATTTLSVAPALLGANGPQTTLVILQSPAESRAGGGLVGGYVLLRADHGHVSMAESGTNHDLANAPSPVVSLGAQYDALYTAYGGRQVWVKSNLSPDFPKTGEIWGALFRAQHGFTPDAEIGITPAVLDDLLAVTGPVTLPSGERVSSGEADRLLQIGLYKKYPTFADETARNAFQLSFLQTTVKAALSDRADPATLLRRLGPSVDTGALRLHVTDPTSQDRVAATPLGGALTAAPGPFFGVFTNSTDGTKLGAYLQEAVTYRRSPATDGKQTVQLSVALVNHAPTSGLPPYVDTRALPAGEPNPGPGSHQFLLYLYLATGARNPAVTLDGKKVTPLSVTVEQNHLLVVLLPPPLAGAGGHAAITVTATEPASAAAPRFLAQPSLIPTTYTIIPGGRRE